ncbi:MAG: hypothetical protein J6O62_00185 [Bacilli bacterium]|nr:hypothetical protein [Bacilli bacterium]
MNKFMLRANYKTTHNINYCDSYDLFVNGIRVRTITGKEASDLEKNVIRNNIEETKTKHGLFIYDQKFIKNNVRIPSKYVKRDNKYGKVVAVATPLVIMGLLSILSSNKKIDTKADTPSYETVIEVDDDMKEISSNETQEVNVYESNESSLEELPNLDFIYQDNNFNEKNKFTFEWEDISNLQYSDEFLYESYLSPYIENSSKKCGEDKVLIAAIVAAENKFGVKNDSGIGGHGRMQTEHIWDGNEVTYFNHNTNSWDSKLININDVDNNDEIGIDTGCMIFNSYYNYFYSNYTLDDKDCLIVSLFAYNKGIGSGMDALSYSHNQENDTYDINKAISYFKNLGYGDDDYLEHVLSGIPDETVLTMKTFDGVEHQILIDNLKYNKNEELNNSPVL